LIYRLNEKYLIPPFFVRVTLSFAIVLLALAVILLAAWLTGADAFIENLPRPLFILLNLSGAYAAFGAIFLYILMWIYLIGFDRTSLLARLGWAIVLLFTLHIGALIYYFVAFSRIRRTSTVQVVTSDLDAQLPRL
jgi:hypothetical protein